MNTRSLEDQKAASVTPPYPSHLHLAISNRYQGAWGEHAIRIAQRQTVLQIYLAAAVTLFVVKYSKYFISPDTDKVSRLPNYAPILYVSVPHLSNNMPFLAIAMTVLALGSSALILIHNVAIFNLTTFMKRCEECAQNDIGHKDLFYFGAKGDNGTDVHKLIRAWTRAVLYVMLLMPGVLSIILDGDVLFTRGWRWFSIGILLILVLILSVALAVGDWIYDRFPKMQSLIQWLIGMREGPIQWLIGIKTDSSPSCEGKPEANS